MSRSHNQRGIELRTPGLSISVDRSVMNRIWKAMAVVTTTASVAVAVVVSQTPLAQ
jgi:hypothetical protein